MNAVKPKPGQPSPEQVATALAHERFRVLNPFDAAWRAGAKYEPCGEGRGSFTLTFLNRPLRVTFPEGEVEAMDGGPRPGYAWRLLILHYLITADGHPMADRWATFRELPDGLMYHVALRNRTEPHLLRAFGAQPERLIGAARALGGVPISFGDVGFMFDVLPRVRMAVVVYAGDDEFPPAVNVLYDAAACHYLPIDDVAVLCGILVGALLKAASAAEKRN